MLPNALKRRPAPPTPPPAAGNRQSQTLELLHLTSELEGHIPAAAVIKIVGLGE